MLNFEFYSRAPNEIGKKKDRHAYAYCNLNGLGRPVFHSQYNHTNATSLCDFCVFTITTYAHTSLTHICAAFEYWYLMLHKPKTNFIYNFFFIFLQTIIVLSMCACGFCCHLFSCIVYVPLQLLKKFFCHAYAELVVRLRYPVSFFFHSYILFIALFALVWLSTFLASNCWELFWLPWNGQIESHDVLSFKCN